MPLTPWPTHGTEPWDTDATLKGYIDDRDEANADALTAHETDTTDAHDATAISTTGPYDDVQEYLDALVAGSVGPWYNPVSYGADKTGVANSTTAIQAAIDAAYAAGGGMVLFDVGTYKVDTLTLKENVTLRGSFMETAGIAAPPPGVSFIPGSNTGAFVQTDGAVAAQKCAIVGISMYGGGTKAEGIRIKPCYRPVIKDCYVTAISGSALVLESGAVGAIVKDNGFFGLATPAVAHTGVVHILSADHVFTGNQVGRGVNGTATAGQFSHAWYVGGANCWFDNNNGEFSDHGWYVIGFLNKFTACRGDRNNLGDWVLSDATCHHNQFVGCAAYDGALDTSVTTESALTVGANTFLNVFVGFQWASGTGVSRYQYGIKDNTSYLTGSGANQYIGCDGIVGANAGALLGRFNLSATLGPRPLEGGATTFPTINTATASVANASCVNFTAYNTNTTVTDFTDWVPGQKVVVIGDANVTIAQTGNIRTLNGGPTLLVQSKPYYFQEANGIFYEVGSTASTATSVSTSGTGAINLSSINLGDQFTYIYTMTGNSTLAAAGLPTGVAGRPGTFRLILVQDGTGGRTFSTTNINWAGRGVAAPGLTKTAGGFDIIDFYWNGSGWYASIPFSTRPVMNQLAFGNANGALSFTPASFAAADDVCYSVTLTGNATLAPTGLPTMTTNQFGRVTLRVTQDGTGSRTLTYDATILAAGGTKPVLSTAANAKDVHVLTWTGTEWVVSELAKGIA